MKKEVKSIIVAVLVSLVIIGVVLAAFFIGKMYSDMKNDALYGVKEYQVVGNAFSGIRYYEWPEHIVKKNNYFDPDTLYHKVEVPKILIDTEVTKKINEKIYNEYSKYINDVKTNGEAYITYEVDISYTYKVKNNIVFILIEENMNSSKVPSTKTYKYYYYDIKNDKELTTEDICTMFNIQTVQIEDATAKEIYGVMPNSLTHFDVYYIQNEPCLTTDCKAVGIIRNVG